MFDRIKKSGRPRKNGNTVRVGYTKLIINGVEWKWNRGKKGLQKSDPRN